MMRIALSQAARPAATSPRPRWANAASSRLPPSSQVGPACGEGHAAALQVGQRLGEPALLRQDEAAVPAGAVRQPLVVPGERGGGVERGAGRPQVTRHGLQPALQEQGGHPELPGRGTGVASSVSFGGDPRGAQPRGGGPVVEQDPRPAEADGDPQPGLGIVAAGPVERGVDRRAFGGGDGHVRGLTVTADVRGDRVGDPRDPVEGGVRGERRRRPLRPPGRRRRRGRCRAGGSGWRPSRPGRR